MVSIAENVFVHPSSSQSGEVEVGEYSSLWPSSSIRGDFSPIRVGRGTSIQDCCVLHSTPSDGVEVGDLVTVGHGAVLHGCVVEHNSIIGMHATVLDKAVIGRGSIVAAGAVVKEGTKVPPGSFVAGVPAEVRPGKEGQEERTKAGALSYVALALNYMEGKETIGPEELVHKMGDVKEKLGEV